MRYILLLIVIVFICFFLDQREYFKIGGKTAPKPAPQHDNYKLHHNTKIKTNIFEINHGKRANTLKECKNICDQYKECKAFMRSNKYKNQCFIYKDGYELVGDTKHNNKVWEKQYTQVNKCNRETQFYDRESDTCVNRPDFERAYENFLDKIPKPREKKKVEYIKPDPKMTMDKQDFFMNMCPRDYHLKQIKLREKMSRSNQLPGYTSHTSFEAMRQIPDPSEPFPIDADFF